MTPEEYFNKYKEFINKCYKRPIPIQAEKTTKDGFVETKEGPVSYTAGAYIITGVEGERYPVEKDFFESNYVPTEDGRFKKKYIEIEFLPLVEDVKVPAGPNNDKLDGKALPENTNIIVRHQKDENGKTHYGVISNDIFKKTYEIIAPEKNKENKGKNYDLDF